MNFVLFYHSLVSDWNHGNAHFLRGIVAELQARGHRVRVWEPAAGWSRTHLLQEQGPAALEAFQQAFPDLHSHTYDEATIDLAAAMDGAQVVLVHEWNQPGLIARIARQAPAHCRVLFHDTHHRCVTAPQEMARYDLSGYDGVLAFGEAVRQQYLHRGWGARAWTWHEAADTALFQPRPACSPQGDLVWVGNWGDDERTAELDQFLIQPVRRLGLRARIHGVRYPSQALDRLRQAGISFGGWLPNHRVAEVFGQYRMTVHVPRRPYVEALPGIPTIRVFEALACGIPLVCAPWSDTEHLFRPGRDYLVAQDGAQMQRHLRELLHDPAAAAELATHGLETIQARHTCAHRVDELMTILSDLGVRPSSAHPSTQPSLSHA